MRTPKKQRADNVLTMSSRDGDVPALLDQDEVSRRAFELYCARGCEAGHDLDDWLSAERQLSAAPRVITAT
jgi:hypothetical protein